MLKRKKNRQKIFALSFATVIVFAFTAGKQGSKSGESPLFYLQKVEVEVTDSTFIPIDEPTLLEGMPLYIGKTNLFQLDLKPVEKKLQSFSWIKSFEIQKKLPDTLHLQIQFRKPVALLSSKESPHSYLCEDGKVVTDTSLMRVIDLPTVEEVSIGNPVLLLETAQLIQAWEKEQKLNGIELSSLTYDSVIGFRALIRFEKYRPLIDLGFLQDFKSSLIGSRLHQIFDYASRRNLPIQQIFVGDGKKFVVKTTTGS